MRRINGVLIEWDDEPEEVIEVKKCKGCGIRKTTTIDFIKKEVRDYYCGQCSKIASTKGHKFVGLD